MTWGVFWDMIWQAIIAWLFGTTAVTLSVFFVGSAINTVISGDRDDREKRDKVLQNKRSM